MKFLMIGNQDSGKTTYMASAYGRLHSGIAGFHIAADKNTEDWFDGLYKKIRTGQYPKASEKKASYQFMLYHHNVSVLGFEWIDYNGGIITTVNANQFYDDIDNCDGVMLFFDAEALRDGKQSATQLRRIASLVVNKVQTFEKRLFTIELVITKTDKLNDLEELKRVLSILQPFIDNASKACNDSRQVVARIVPTSCTAKQLCNVELPLADMLDSGLCLDVLKAQKDLQESIEKANSYNAKSGILDWIDSKLSGVPTYKEMAENELQRARQHVALMESIAEHRNKLFEYVKEYDIKIPCFEGTRGMESSSKNSSSKRLIRF